MLRKGAIPSVFSFRPEGKSIPTKRCRDRESSTIGINNVQNEVIVSCEIPVEEDLNNLCENESPEESKCPILGSFSIEQLKFDPKKVKYYTSFKDYDHFMFFYHCLGPAVNHLSYKSCALSLKDELFFLTLIKLRQD